VLAHHLGRRHARQIGRPLMLARRAEGLAECEQHDRARKQRGEDAEQQQRRLPPLAPTTTAPMSAWRHDPGRSPASRVHLNAPTRPIGDKLATAGRGAWCS
jgi:hypothetical protein